MSKKWIPIVGKGYTVDFFCVKQTDEELVYTSSLLKIEKSHTATLAFELDDDGLSGLGLDSGDFLLFTDYSLTPITNKIILLRMEGEFIIRIAKLITPETCILSTSKGKYPPLLLNSENVRIVGVMTGFIKSHDNIEILSGGDFFERSYN